MLLCYCLVEGARLCKKGEFLTWDKKCMPKNGTQPQPEGEYTIRTACSKGFYRAAKGECKPRITI